MDVPTLRLKMSTSGSNLAVLPGFSSYWPALTPFLGSKVSPSFLSGQFCMAQNEILTGPFPSLTDLQSPDDAVVLFLLPHLSKVKGEWKLHHPCSQCPCTSCMLH